MGSSELWENQKLDAVTRHALGCDGKLSIRGLVLWCRTHLDMPVFLNDSLSFEEHCEQVHMELSVTCEHFPNSQWKGVMEGSEVVEDAEAEGLKVAQSLALPEENWPRVRDEPTPIGAPGRFAKCIPLCFPMGIADMHGDRFIEVSPSDWL